MKEASIEEIWVIGAGSVVTKDALEMTLCKEFHVKHAGRSLEEDGLTL